MEPTKPVIKETPTPAPPAKPPVAKKPAPKRAPRRKPPTPRPPVPVRTTTTLTIIDDARRTHRWVVAVAPDYTITGLPEQDDFGVLTFENPLVVNGVAYPEEPVE